MFRDPPLRGDSAAGASDLDAISFNPSRNTAFTADAQTSIPKNMSKILIANAFPDKICSTLAF